MIQAGWDDARCAENPAYSEQSGSQLLQQSQMSSSFSKPPRPKRLSNKHQSKHRAQESRGQSRRRFHSTSMNRASRSERRIVIQPQPGGWYQAERITRNLSLAPRNPSYEPSMARNFSGDHAMNKRKARKRRKALERWQCQNRFPSPSVFRTTLSMLQELPCARIHYNTFKRMFPSLPTRTAKERRFRLEAAQEMPFAKYPNQQMRAILDSDTCTEHSSQVSKGYNRSSVQPNITKHSKEVVEGDIHYSDDANEIQNIDDTSDEDSSDSNSEDATDSDVEETHEPTIEEEPEKRLTEQNSTILHLGICESHLTNNKETILDTSPITQTQDEPIITVTAVPSACGNHLGEQESECKTRKSPTPIRSSRKPPPPSLFKTAKPKSTSICGLLCNACGKAAYSAERLEADGQVFHVKCFRCHHCSTMLQRGAWNQRGTQYFCNPCHRRIALQTLRH